VVILLVPAVRNQWKKCYKELILYTYRKISWDLNSSEFVKTLKRIFTTIFLAISICLVFLATPFVIPLCIKYEKENKKKQAKAEKEVEDNQLYFTRMSGAGTFYCKDCARKGNIIGFLHGLVNPEYDAITGYQCQSCGKFHKIRSRLEGYQVIYIDPLVCSCGGELSRDKPVFCPHCKSTKGVGYRTSYIT
jgi:hypothetical protein